MFTGIIKEYPGVPHLQGGRSIGGTYYFGAGNYIVGMNSDLREDLIVKRGNEIDTITFGVGGLWIFYYSDQSEGSPIADGYQAFIDIFDKKINISPPDFCVAEGLFLKKKCIAIHSPTYDDHFLVIHDFETGSTSTIPAEFGDISTDGAFIYLRKYQNGRLQCYDFSLNLIWEQRYQKISSFSGPEHPMLYEDLVLVNQGVEQAFEDDEQRRFGLGGKITAYAKSDGSRLWSREFERGVICVLIDGILYTTHNGWIHMIDVRTGETRLEKHSGIENPHSYDRVWCDGDYLFYISVYESKVIIFDKAGNPLQTLKIPAPYAFYNNHQMFYRFKDYYLIELNNGSKHKASYGLLVLRPSKEDGSFTVQCEPRPTNHLECMDASDDKQEYRVTIRDDSIENILRYGTLLMNECAYFNGYHMWSNGNKKFNGRIHLKAEMKDIDKHLPAIEEMLSEFEKYCDCYSVYAGDGRTPIKAILET